MQLHENEIILTSPVDFSPIIEVRVGLFQCQLILTQFTIIPMNFSWYNPVSNISTCRCQSEYVVRRIIIIGFSMHDFGSNFRKSIYVLYLSFVTIANMWEHFMVNLMISDKCKSHENLKIVIRRQWWCVRIFNFDDISREMIWAWQMIINYESSDTWKMKNVKSHLF